MAAEFALALPGVVLALATLLCAGRVVLTQVECHDAARAAARVAARGDSADVVRATALAAAPPGASVQIQTGTTRVRVEVTSEVRLLGVLGGEVRTHGDATAAVEGVG